MTDKEIQSTLRHFTKIHDVAEQSYVPSFEADQAHVRIELLVPVELHRKLRHDPEFRKTLIEYANEQVTKENTNETL